MNELFESSYLSIMSAENDRLRKQLQQKENIIKEVREYIEKETKELYNKNKNCKYLGEIMQLECILQILDKINEMENK